MASKSYTFKVTMTCNGCLDAVKRSANVTIPKKFTDLTVESIDGNLTTQTVTIRVKSKSGSEENFPQETEILELVKKSGKVASLI